MVDVGAKPFTERIAQAGAEVRAQPETIQLLREGAFEKGDVLAVARVAGIMAAKRTAELIPLCHPIPLTAVNVEISLEDESIQILTTARTTGQTGVEMEALTASAVTALTIYDMCKSVDRSMVIGDVKLLSKSGGRSGEWRRDAANRVS